MIKKNGNEFVASLTVREYIAIHAMEGLTSITYSDERLGPSPPAIAQVSVAIADAMIAELNKDQK